MTKSGRFSRRQKRISSANAASLRGSTQNCAGPADAQGRVLRERLVKTHVAFFADDLLQPLRDDQIGREHRELFVNIAGAQAENQIARGDHVAHDRNAADRAAADS